ncbi:hypothetical protein M514_16338, partial [Trichuris suis]
FDCTLSRSCCLGHYFPIWVFTQVLLPNLPLAIVEVPELTVMSSLHLTPAGRLRPVILDGRSLLSYEKGQEKPSVVLLTALKKFIAKGHRAIVTIAQYELDDICRDVAEATAFEFMKRHHLLAVFNRRVPPTLGDRGILDQEFAGIVKEAFVTGALIVSNDKLEIVCVSHRSLKSVSERIIKFCWIGDRLALYPDNDYADMSMPKHVYDFAPEEKVGKVVSPLDDVAQRFLLSAIDKILSKADAGNRGITKIKAY